VFEVVCESVYIGNWKVVEGTLWKANTGLTLIKEKSLPACITTIPFSIRETTVLFEYPENNREVKILVQ
jgi:hypothetical protein